MRIAVFASGSGTNAEKLMEHFRGSEWGKIQLVLTQNPHAGVLVRAEKAGVMTRILDKSIYTDGNALLRVLREFGCSFIVLSGYLKLIPAEVIRAFPGRIVNIHPSLLPKYGGKGMYGRRVHEAVIAAREKVSGITIHFVNEVYDQGEVISQEKVEIGENWDAARLEAEIHKLEYRFFPQAVESVLKNLVSNTQERI